MKLFNMEVRNLNEAIHTPNALPSYKKFHDKIIKIFEEGQGNYSQKISSRIFIAGGTRDDFSDKVLKDPKGSQEDACNWLKRVTGSETFTFAMNGINGLDEEIHKIVVEEFARPWIEAHGGSLGGIDCYMFAGKYPKTPFGIHTDAEHTFLFHLGPSDKIAWIWTPEAYQHAASNLTSQFLFDKVESAAEKIILKPGDGLLIPSGYPHVLENPGFSITLGIAPYDKTLRDLLAQAFKPAIAVNTVNLDRPYTTECDGQIVLPFDYQTFSNVDIAGLVMEEVHSENLRLKSIDFMKFGPASRFVDINEDTIVSLSSYGDATIHSASSSGTTKVFLCGNSFDIPNQHIKTFENLMTDIAPEEGISISQLISNSADEDTLLGLIYELASKGCISVKNYA